MESTCLGCYGTEFGPVQTTFNISYKLKRAGFYFAFEWGRPATPKFLRGNELQSEATRDRERGWLRNPFLAY